MKTLVLLRHGESTWNLENRFTGWTDVDLTPKGIEEAHEAGRLLREGGYTFDVCLHLAAQARHPDAVDRASTSMDLDVGAGAQELAPQRAPLRRAPGPQQGGDRRQVRRRSRCWSGAAATPIRRRRSTAEDPRFPGHDPRYAGLAAARAPARRVAQGHRRPLPALLAERSRPRCGPGSGCSSPPTATACARWSSTSTASPRRRSSGLNIPTGIPLVYELDDELKPLRHYYLGDPEAAARRPRRWRSRPPANPDLPLIDGPTHSRRAPVVRLESARCPGVEGVRP